MNKIKVLELNNVDLPGKRFNGYDLISSLSCNKFEIKQVVIEKTSNNDAVVEVFKNDSYYELFKSLKKIETRNSITNVLSITSPVLTNLEEYKKSDIIHFHMFHNSGLSIYSLLKIASEKKVVISLHDAWFMTGRCIHFYNCNKWQTGCNNCKNLNTLFPFKEDNCNYLWELKKYVFSNLNIDIIVSSKWMYNLVEQSPIFNDKQRIHLIPFGIDLNKFNQTTTDDAKSFFGISADNIVLFLRAQKEFKGTEFVLEALHKLDTNQKITILTCETKKMLDSIKNKYRIIDLGYIEEETMLLAMKACDMFLMPSKSESFGMMAVEAMASSKPVIIFDNSALPSVTFAPDCGYLVRDRDSNELMLAIKDLIDNSQERQRRGILGYEICKKYYDISKYHNAIKEVYLNTYNKMQFNKIPKKANKLSKNNYEKLLKNKTIDLKSMERNLKFESLSIDDIAYIDYINETIYKRLENGEIRIKVPIINKLKNIIKKHKRLYKFLKGLGAVR